MPNEFKDSTFQLKVRKMDFKEMERTIDSSFVDIAGQKLKIDQVVGEARKRPACVNTLSDAQAKIDRIMMDFKSLQ